MNYKKLLTLLLLCISTLTQAEERWFEVELILFQRNIEFTTITEDLAQESATINSDNAVPLLIAEESDGCIAETEEFTAETTITEPPIEQQADILTEPQTITDKSSFCLHKPLPVTIDETHFALQDNGFHLLLPEQLQLTEQLNKLNQHNAFQPLLHLGWRMPVKSRATAQPLHLYAGENFAEQDGQQDIWAIDGNFKIFLDHYLYIDSQLTVRQQQLQNADTVDNREPTFEIINSENSIQILKQNETFPDETIEQEAIIKETLFDQNRRLRSGEVHYFDHPLMGIIVQVRKIPEDELTLLTAPVDSDEQQTTEEPATQSD